MKCDELKKQKYCQKLAFGDEVYLAKEADEAIAELKEEVNNLLMQNRELCQALQVMYSAEEYTKLQDENAELKKKLYDTEMRADLAECAETERNIDYNKLKAEADNVIAELKKERDWLAKDRAQAYYDLEKRAQLNIKQELDIADLEKRIKFLQVTAICNDCNKCADGMGKVFDETLDELKAQKAQAEDDCAYWKAKAQRERHHKYKRCLDKAEWCESKVYHIRRTPLCDMSEHEYWQYENDFWQRWHKHWLGLAEKFKEA